MFVNTGGTDGCQNDTRIEEKQVAWLTFYLEGHIPVICETIVSFLSATAWATLIFIFATPHAPVGSTQGTSVWI